MDDAYQHLKVRASCYFLLTTFARPFTSDYLLPAGDLREMRMNAERAPLRHRDQDPRTVHRKYT